MNYDKNSFLAGYTVGRQVKGWCYIDGSGGDQPTPPTPPCPETVYLPPIYAGSFKGNGHFKGSYLLPEIYAKKFSETGWT